MQEDLLGKVALVTGSSRGLGRHYALHLAQAGADVIIHDLSESAAAAFGEAASGPAVAKQIRACGRRSAFFAADLTEAAQVEQLVRQAVAAFDHIDILVNNAGGDMGAHTPRPDPNNALDIAPDDIRAVLERNLLTTMYTCKYVGLHMRARRSGKIINVGSSAGHVAVQTGSIYAAAKAGVSGFRPSEEMMKEHPEVVRMYTDLEDAFEKHDVARAVEVSLALWTDGQGRLPGQAAPDVRERVREMTTRNWNRPDDEAQAQTPPVPLEPPAIERLSTIGVPTLVILEEWDGPNPLEQLAAEIPGAKKVIMAETAHHPFMEKPAEFNQIVLDFLGSLTS